VQRRHAPQQAVLLRDRARDADRARRATVRAPLSNTHEEGPATSRTTSQRCT
jgi:hypothetical protein